MRITVGMVMAERPCSLYQRARVEQLWAGREGLSEHEVTMLEIPLGDIAWLLSRMLGPRDTTREVARRIARDAIGDREIPPAYQAWSDTGDEALRPAARCAARTLAEVMDSPAWLAAWNSTGVVDSDVVRNAAMAAAKAAAKSALWDAAWDAAMRKYIGWMADWLDSHGEE